MIFKKMQKYVHFDERPYWDSQIAFFMSQIGKIAAFDQVKEIEKAELFILSFPKLFPKRWQWCTLWMHWDLTSLWLLHTTKLQEDETEKMLFRSQTFPGQVAAAVVAVMN